jgi:hypothetical protein
MSTFWNQRPVPASIKNMVFSQQIDPKPTPIQTVPKSQYTIVNLDQNNLEEIVDFLNANYHDSKFTLVDTNNLVTTKKYHTVFDKSFIPSNSQILGLRLNYNNQLVGLMVGTPKTYQLKNKKSTGLQVTLLCINKLIRGKSTTTYLMSEFVNRFQSSYPMGLFFTEATVPTPISKVSVYKRPLNPQKLYDIGYFEIKDKTVVTKMIDKYTIIRKLPSNIIKLNPEWIPKLHSIYNEYMERFDFHQIYTLEEFTSYITEPHVDTYVIFSKQKDIVADNILDFFSFGRFQIRTELTTLNCANLLLYTAQSDEITSRRLADYASIAAFTEQLDLLYLTNTSELSDVLSDIDNCYTLDCTYNINLYNWELPPMKPEQLALSVPVV